jgi:hypothetical protein
MVNRKSIAALNMAMCSVHQLPRTDHPGKPGYAPGLYLDEVRDDLPFRPAKKNCPRCPGEV